MEYLKDKITVLVNSCDLYEDIWNPFFKLFKKYGGELTKCNIVLNTESKSYDYPGLNILSYALFKESNPAWGERLKRTLEKIKTEYVITFMEDFFLVNKVDDSIIKSVIDWMEQDEKIGAFHMIPLDCVEENESIYPGFYEVKPGVPYRCNTQVCIWRKSVLYKSILNKESPWIWEDIGRLRNDVLLVSKVYALGWKESKPIDYNFYVYGKMNELNRTYCHSGVIKGKWNLEVVKTLFRDNDIDIDYYVRGVYKQSVKDKIRSNYILNKILIRPYRKMKKMIKGSRKCESDYNRYIREYVTPYLNYEKF